MPPASTNTDLPCAMQQQCTFSEQLHYTLCQASGQQRLGKKPTHPRGNAKMVWVNVNYVNI